MEQQEFKVSFEKGKNGHTFPVLTAQQFPYPNLQVVPLNDQNREYVLERLESDCGGYRMAEGRNDYAVILAGGTSDEHPKMVITQENHKEIDRLLLEAMQHGADWWAVHEKEYVNKP